MTIKAAVVIGLLILGPLVTPTIIGVQPVMGYMIVPIRTSPPGSNAFQILGWNIGEAILQRFGLITIARNNVTHTQTEYIAPGTTIGNSVERTLLQPIEQAMHNSTTLTQNQKTYELQYIQELRKTIYSPTYFSSEIGKHTFTPSIVPTIKSIVIKSPLYRIMSNTNTSR